jgi:hypothetical protein
MITAIEIENFKGISAPVRLELRPITLLFGQNSSGKSSLLHALIYAREVFERHNLDADRTLVSGEHLDFGGFRTLVHGHDLRRPVRIAFELDLSHVDLPTEDYSRPDAIAPAQMRLIRQMRAECANVSRDPSPRTSSSPAAWFRLRKAVDETGCRKCRAGSHYGTFVYAPHWHPLASACETSAKPSR